ncbi:MAG: hypothetical protein AB7G80_09845 [Dongiaceae bacterium]
MKEPVFRTGRWIIAFYDEGPRNWWDYFTRPGFRHCLAIRYLEDIDAWVTVDSSNHGLFVEFVPKRFIDAIIVAVNDRGGRFVEIDARAQGRRLWPPLFLYCVSAMKELVGIRDWRVITPWQLYCALMKMGGKRMFDLSNFKENADGQSIFKTQEATT